MLDAEKLEGILLSFCFLPLTASQCFEQVSRIVIVSRPFLCRERGAGICYRSPYMESSLASESLKSPPCSIALPTAAASKAAAGTGNGADPAADGALRGVVAPRGVDTPSMRPRDPKREVGVSGALKGAAAVATGSWSAREGSVGDAAPSALGT